MKRILSILIATIVLFSVAWISASANNDEISVYVDAKKIEFDVKPQIINERTMVPIRAIFEEMGAVVEWDSSTGTATCTKGDTVVKMAVNSINMYVNNQLVEMDTTPVVINGRTLAPARYVAEAFGATVEWSQKSNTVVICSKDVYAYTDYPDIPDLGKCYNVPILQEYSEDRNKYFSYVYSDLSNDDYYSYLYDNSALVLGSYAEESIGYKDGVLTIAYTKAGEIIPRYYIGVTDTEDGSMVFVVMIPDFTNSSKEPVKHYYDATNEVNQIKNFISRGMYLEAIKVCEETLAWHDLSESDKLLISGLKSDAENKYSTYLYNLEKNKTATIADYKSAEDFESALNNGKDVINKKVTFYVDEFVPDSVFGYNLQAGEHLNFCSSKDPKARRGDTVTVRVTDVYSFLGSYIISYELVK